ncbi:MAG TPA: pitrilysin family protein [Candidatus Polarisedimenticolaceae bacterium]|nr:pitrilysin family protein [Candidatus Polarisedimenticolaceae bacterium]
MIGALLLAAAAAAAPRLHPVETTLENGLVVTIVPDPTMPLVATQVWYHVGAANEGKAERGLAHLFEHLMFGATATYARGDYSRFVASVGGDENAYTTPDETVYVAEVPPAAFAEVLKREADRMRGLVLSQANLDNEKRIVVEELRLRTENDPVARLLVKAQEALLGDHPYAYDPSGSKEDVQAATVDTCRAFYDRYYHPNHAQVVVAGPVDAAAALETIRAAFGPLPAGGAAPDEIPELLHHKFPSALDLKEDIPPVEVALVGVPLPAADAPDAPAVEVLVAMLTGLAVDPVRDEIVSQRKKALEAGIQSLALRRGGGLVFFSASLPYRRKKTAERLLDDAVAKLGKLAWLDEGTLRAAKAKLLLARARDGYRAENVAQEAGQALWWEGSTARAFDRSARLEAVSREDVAAAWRRYVESAPKIRVYVKPEHVPVLVRMFGWLYPLFS